jgi:hypothetical protein
VLSSQPFLVFRYIFVDQLDHITRLPVHSNNLLDPIIISDTMNYIYSDVLKIPSEISDHDASVAFLQCPKSAAG